MLAVYNLVRKFLPHACRRERERENFICKAGTPAGQSPIYAGAYVTVAYIITLTLKRETSKNKQTMCI